jgi:hypothetical protein
MKFFIEVYYFWSATVSSSPLGERLFPPKRGGLFAVGLWHHTLDGTAPFALGVAEEGADAEPILRAADESLGDVNAAQAGTRK